MSKKINIKKIAVALLWLGLGSATTVLLVAAVQKKDTHRCKGVGVEITGVNNNFFIDKKDVFRIIARNSGGSITGKPVSAFRLRDIETELEKDVWIKNAELFFDNNDVLRAEVSEREPIARIFSVGGNSFYIDSSLKVLPLSDKFSARLSVFTGYMSDGMKASRTDSLLLGDIRTMSTLIQEDSFLMAMIDQVDIVNSNQFELIPKVGRQTISFGDATEAQAKMQKLKLFYRKVMAKTSWNMYSRISLQYHGQVVAKVWGKEDVSADSLRTLQMMQVIATNAAKQAADSIASFVPDTDKNTADTSLIQQSLQRDEEAEPPISNTVEKPSPQEQAASPVVVPVAKPAPKPVITKTTPATKPVVKPPPVKKPAAKVVAKPVTKPLPKPTPKAVMKKKP
jgi:cell division protein FtsQ